jgi:hypothetical protein
MHSICTSTDREFITGKDKNGIVDGLLRNSNIVNMTEISSNNILRAHMIRSI